MADSESFNRRRSKRSMVENIFTTLEIEQSQVRAQVADLSEGGMKLKLPAGAEPPVQESIRLSIDEIAPSIQGKVKWVSDDPENPDQKLLGIQFESLEIRPVGREDQVTHLDVPIEPESPSQELARFLRMVEGIDHKIIEGEIGDLTEALLSASRWIEIALGPVNVWYSGRNSEGERSAQLLIDHGHGGPEHVHDRAEQVIRVVDMLGELKRGEAHYISGDPVVLEFYCDLSGREDAMLNISKTLGCRMDTWSKLIIKNISIKFIGDELERRIEDRTRELELSVQLANEANRAKSEFLSNMSHEMRTPLNAVLGCAEALEKGYFGDLTAKQAEYVADIRSSGSHLLDLINDVLDLAKVESGRFDLTLTTFNVKPMMESVLRSVHSLADRKSQHLSLVLPPEWGDLEATTDKQILTQVLFNLLGNAVKFSGENGQIELSGESRNGRLQISVSDDGIGIDAAEQENIFQRFYQVKSVKTGKTPGTGMGLSLSTMFMELLGGSIQVESAGEGKGSRFKIEMPLHAQPDRGPSS